MSISSNSRIMTTKTGSVRLLSSCGSTQVDFRSLVQGDLTIIVYCHRLKALPDALAGVDQPVSGETLVLQMILCFNSKFDTTGTILPTQQPFPTFIQARSILLLEETAQNTIARNAATSALVAASSNPSPGDRGDRARHDGECFEERNYDKEQ